MGRSCDLVSDDDESSESGRKIIMHPLYLPKLPPWFDLRVFYVRIGNCELNDSTSDHLTVTHIPLSPDTVLEVNGRRSGIYSDSVSSTLRRDRVDRNSEEATFVSTDSIRMTGTVRFEVFDGDAMLLDGVLELSNGNSFNGESKNHIKKWSMECQSALSAGTGFLKCRKNMSSEMPLPFVEVYVAGCFSGNPIILTKSLQLCFRKKNHKVLALDSIPEDDATELKKDLPSDEDLQLSRYLGYKMENDVDIDYDSIYSRAEYTEEDGELSWFNAGVRVGVGIGLGICVGIGIGVGLLVRTYQGTTRNFKRQLP